MLGGGARLDARSGGLGLCLGLGGLGALPGPLLVELHPPFSVLRLAPREVGPEAASAAAAEPGDRAGGVTGLDELSRDGDRQLLARLGLPDHEPATRALARPAGGG